MTSGTLTPERRQHFRILDQAVVEHLPLPDHHPDLASLFPPSLQLALRADLRALDDEIEPALRRIADQDRATANGLRLLGRKLDRLVQAFCQDDEGPAPGPVTLSEGGLSFMASAPLKTGAPLALRLRLQPGGEGIVSAARVVYSLALEDGSWRIGLCFVDLDAGARDLLARHLLAHQARERRAAARPEHP
jgi:hypothetical protein